MTLFPGDKFLLISSTSEQFALSRGLCLLRSANFWGAHELFEEAWRAAHPPSRTLFHGLAQLAASYHQLQLGRARASVRTWNKCAAKLAAVGALDPSFAHAVGALHAALGIDAEQPRFIAREALQGVVFPVPERSR